MVEVFVFYTPSEGWKGGIPGKAMPLYGAGSCEPEEPEGCGVTVCPCESIVRTQHPSGISFSQDVDFFAVFPGQPNPFLATGPALVVPDWLAVTIRLDPPTSCNTDPRAICPEGSASTCRGMDLWYRIVVAMP